MTAESPEDRAVAIADEFHKTAHRLAPLVGEVYREVPLRLLDEVLCELTERGVIS